MLRQRQRILTRLAFAGAFAAISIVAAGCGFSTEDEGGSPEPATEGITLYSGRIPPAIGGAVDIYEEDADRDVQVRFAETADLAATLVEEGDNSPADVFFAQEPGAIGALAADGLLMKLPRKITELVDPAYRDPSGFSVSVTGRARVLAYNKDAVERSELPPSPLDLTEPEWKDRVGWGPATSSMQQYVTALRLALGDDVVREWLEEMVANGTVAYRDNVTIRDAIARGEIDVGLINHYYVAQAIAAEGPDYPVGVYFPPKGLGSLVLTTSAAVLASTDRREEALDFVRSLLSEPSQDFFTTTSKEYPLAEGAKPDPTLEVPLSEIPAPDPRLFDVTELQATIEMMEEAGAL